MQDRARTTEPAQNPRYGTYLRSQISDLRSQELNSDQGKPVPCLEVRHLRSQIRDLKSVAASKFYGQAKGLISSGQLSTLLHLHTHPINLVVYQESRCQN